MSLDRLSETLKLTKPSAMFPVPEGEALDLFNTGSVTMRYNVQPTRETSNKQHDSKVIFIYCAGRSDPNLGGGRPRQVYSPTRPTAGDAVAVHWRTEI
jgi:hypothetical protein